jgi:DNA replication protein DnaC
MDRIANQVEKTRQVILYQGKIATHQQALAKEQAKTKGEAVCSSCKGAGYLRMDVPFGHPQFGKPVPCQCNLEKIKQKKQEQLIHFSGLNTFERFRHASFETYDPFVRGVRDAYIQAFEFACLPTGWLVLIGEYGCGKTHLAVSIAKKRIEAGNLVLFQVVPRLLDYLRATFSPDSEQDYDERFQQMCNVDMLILDDLGAQNNTPWANDKLFQLLNYRYNANAPTVITINTASWERMEPRLYSRFMDKHLVQLIKMDQAQDYRIHGL